MSREKEFDKAITTFFDNLWSNEAYLGWMGQLMKSSFTLRQQWNKNLMGLFELWQIPTQDMQQRTLHQLNTLLTEWRFEQSEMNERLSHMEQELAALKALLNKPATEAK